MGPIRRAEFNNEICQHLPFDGGLRLVPDVISPKLGPHLDIRLEKSALLKIAFNGYSIKTTMVCAWK